MKYRTDRRILEELEISRKVKDLNDHVRCVTDAEIAAQRDAEMTGSYSKRLSARSLFICQTEALKQRIAKLERL